MMRPGNGCRRYLAVIFGSKHALLRTGKMIDAAF